MELALRLVSASLHLIKRCIILIVSQGSIRTTTVEFAGYVVEEQAYSERLIIDCLSQF
jgi:hypothetical protein